MVAVGGSFFLVYILFAALLHMGKGCVELLTGEFRNAKVDCLRGLMEAMEGGCVALSASSDGVPRIHYKLPRHQSTGSVLVPQRWV